MNGQRSNEPVNCVVDAHGTWLISFADLITLLLCSFLMMFSLNWDKQQHVTNMSKEETAPSQTESPGIVIADSPPKSVETKALLPRVELRFTKADFQNDGITFSSEALKKVNNLATSEGYRDAMVTLAVCKGAAGGMADEAELLITAGQVLDAGVTEQRLRYEVLGRGCAGERGKDAPVGDSTKVLMSFERDL